MSRDTHGTSWFNGPAFLEKDEDEWPSTVGDPLDDQDKELRKKSVLVALGIVKEKAEGTVVLEPEQAGAVLNLDQVCAGCRLDSSFSQQFHRRSPP